jgi:hypothetical protein
MKKGFTTESTEKKNGEKKNGEKRIGRKKDHAKARSPKTKTGQPKRNEGAAGFPVKTGMQTTQNPLLHEERAHRVVQGERRREIPRLCKPTVPADRDGKKKSACYTRNDSFVALLDGSGEVKLGGKQKSVCCGRNDSLWCDVVRTPPRTARIGCATNQDGYLKVAATSTLEGERPADYGEC